jgi:hypothetical protein
MDFPVGHCPSAHQKLKMQGIELVRDQLSSVRGELGAAGFLDSRKPVMPEAVSVGRNALANDGTATRSALARPPHHRWPRVPAWRLLRSFTRMRAKVTKRPVIWLSLHSIPWQRSAGSKVDEHTAHRQVAASAPPTSLLSSSRGPLRPS